MKLITPTHGESLLDLAKRCGAVYVCPRVDSRRTGPLVVYAGKDSQGRNLVGDTYFNFARIEEHSEVVSSFAWAALERLTTRGLIDSFDTICGIPHGGRTFGQALARIARKRFVYADRKPKATEVDKKQEYTWDLSRFDFERGERVAIAEDVFHNFQNTDNTLAEIAVTGVEVVLLVGALNRSPTYELHYRNLPISASICEAYPEYQQDDPEVVADIAVSRLELHVKKNWARLMAIMGQ